jgi:crotonobetainyl-CoA:carnitine CoA-transferase CaiB-like acyl-CoA transferase
MAGALDGLRVLDFTTTIAGPHCCRLLADLGAHVIKIEAPEGDMMRTRPPLRNGASSAYGQLNAGKRSVVLDLKSPKAVEAAKRLTAVSDVVIENFRPGVMRRFGLDYEVLKAVKPGLIYCAISGYGQTGPSAELPAYASVIHAASGYDLAHIAHQGGVERQPDYCGIFIADVVTGTYAFGAILAALHQRERTGQGQMIDVSMLESMLSLTLNEMQAAQFAIAKPPRPIFGPITASDGYVSLAIASERTFQALAVACGHPEWPTDPRFAKYDDRRLNWDALIAELELWSIKRSRAEIQAVFDRHGVPSSPYRTVKEAMADPQIAHRGAFTEVEDAGGAFLALNPPFRMSAARTEPTPYVAALGEHTAQVLGEIGYGPEEIAALSGRADAPSRISG